MSKNQLSLTENINVESLEPMAPPSDVKLKLPISSKAAQVVIQYRDILKAILDRKDPRVFMVIGPCSIHDPVAGRDYAHRLKKLADQISDVMVVVMRVYFEKPRTSVGWKGYINDPYMDDSFRINEGIEKARQFLLEINELGLPAATEALDPISPQYMGDLISWTAIGARTTESQTHRELASGLSTPVGFKNGTDGSLDVAVNAIVSASRPHSFLGINENGFTSVVRTKGNPHGHMVLRGGSRPNYDSVSVAMAEEALKKGGLHKNIVLDCSHGNSNKKPELQPLVLKDGIHQIREGNSSIVGFMMESFIEAGSQPIPKNLKELKYGCSVTDACMDWATTEKALLDAAKSLKSIIKIRPE